MLPPRRREDRLRLLVSVSLGGCAQKEHRDSLGLPYKRDMEACAHHVILRNHRQGDYVHSPQTLPSASSAMFAEVGAGYETISHLA